MSFIELAKIKIDNVTLEEALSVLEVFIASKKPHLIVTPNPEIIVAAQEDLSLMKILNNADLRIPDGISMVVVSRIKKCPLKERVAGIDFLMSSCKLATQKNWKIFLLGSSSNIINLAANNLRYKFEGLNIVGALDGYFTLQEEDNVVDAIEKAAPDILFVGLGGVKQEKFIDKYLNKLNVPVCVCVGGSFDVVSGIKKRAPKWIQNLYIEWLYRLFSEPKRWKRQLALPKFLWLTLFKYR